MKTIWVTLIATIVASLVAVTTVVAAFLVFEDGDDGVQMDTLSGQVDSLSTQVAALTTTLATLEAKASKNTLSTPVVIEKVNMGVNNDGGSYDGYAWCPGVTRKIRDLTISVRWTLLGNENGICVSPTSACAREALVGAPLPVSCGGTSQ